MRKPVPYGVGIIFWITLCILSLVYLPLSRSLLAVIAASGILTLVSFIDDQRKVSAILRLAVQSFCALLVIVAGVSIPALSNPFGSPIVLDSISWALSFGSFKLVILPLSWLLAFVWILLVTNAMNWLDGSPGIVSGVSLVSCGILYSLSSLQGLHVIDQSILTSLSVIIAGSCAVFLIFDFPKPQILMGDSGTMFLGFMIAVMAIFSGGKLATAFIALAIPLLDAVWTVARRLLQKKSPFHGDFQHFHHELLRAGLSDRQVACFYYAVSLSFGLISLNLQSRGKLVAIILLFVIMTSIRLSLHFKKPRIRS